MLFGALIPLVPGYVDEFGLSKLQAGLLFGAYGAGALLGGVPGGIIATRVGPKRAVLAGLTVLALAASDSRSPTRRCFSASPGSSRASRAP